MTLPPVAVLAEPVTCFPAWHTAYKKYGGSQLGTVASGCATVNGNVNCDPQAMANAAASKMGVPVSLEAYTLARYFSSEVGSGTVEEKVAVAQAAMNRATYVEKLPNGILDLLLYRQPAGNPHRGYYGPINVTPSTGRWASTSRDPTYGDIVLAIALLDGVFDGFNKGADDQDGMEYPQYFPDPAQTVRTRAQSNNYWVGPLPGVNQWTTFLWRHIPEVSPSSEAGQWLIARGVASMSDPNRKDTPSWLLTPVCGQPLVTKFLPAIAGFGIAGLAGFLAIGIWRKKHNQLGGRADDWWQRRGREDTRLCYRTKTSALQAFREANQETIQRWGGLDAKATPAEFDAINQKYGLTGRKAVKTLARALWVAAPSRPPFCLNDIDVRTLNQTSPGQHGRGFVLPNWTFTARASEEEARHHETRARREREEAAKRAVDEAFDKALAKRGLRPGDVPF